jgi:hypothetical protein
MFRQTGDPSGSGFLFSDQNDARLQLLNRGDTSNENYSVLGSLENYRKADGNLHLKLWWPELDDYREWTQDVNPVSSAPQTVTQFQNIHTHVTDPASWGGLEKSGPCKTTDPCSFLDGLVQDNDWWYSVGAFMWQYPVTQPGYFTGPCDVTGCKLVSRVDLYACCVACAHGWEYATGNWHVRNPPSSNHFYSSVWDDDPAGTVSFSTASAMCFRCSLDPMSPRSKSVHLLTKDVAETWEGGSGLVSSLVCGIPNFPCLV